MRRLIVLCGCLAILTPWDASCYELATHASLTMQGLTRFLRERSDLLGNLGFDRTLIDERSPAPFGVRNFDMGPPFLSPLSRNQDKFEIGIIARIDKSLDPTSIMGWVMTGSIREDDVPIGGDNPNDDPYRNLFRVLNHFYDPANRRALTPCGACELAPNWATGYVDAFNGY